MCNSSHFALNNQSQSTWIPFFWVSPTSDISFGFQPSVGWPSRSAWPSHITLNLPAETFGFPGTSCPGTFRLTHTLSQPQSILLQFNRLVATQVIFLKHLYTSLTYCKPHSEPPIRWACFVGEGGLWSWGKILLVLYPLENLFFLELCFSNFSDHRTSFLQGMHITPLRPSICRHTLWEAGGYSLPFNSWARQPRPSSTHLPILPWLSALAKLVHSLLFNILVSQFPQLEIFSFLSTYPSSKIQFRSHLFCKSFPNSLIQNYCSIYLLVSEDQNLNSRKCI